MTTRETLKSYLNSIGSSADSLTFKHDKEGHVNQYEGVDLGVDPNTEKELIDIENETSGLLGDYLNYITENSTNIFKIAAGIEKATASKRGDSLVLPEEQGAQNVYVNQGTENFSNLSKYSNSGKFEESGNDISTFLDKTGGSSDAHMLYNQIEGSSLSTSGETLTNQEGIQEQPVKSTNDLLNHFNRFANTFNRTAFAPKGKSISDLEGSEDKSGTIKYEKRLGRANTDLNITSFQKLKQMGANLLMKASGYDNADSPEDSLKLEDIESLFSQGGTQSSFYSDAGFQKVHVEKLRARNAKGTPTNVSGESIRKGKGEYFGEEPNAVNSFSFGSSYNSEMPFLGKNRKMLKIQAAIACKALVTVTKDFMRTITETIRLNDIKIIDDSNLATANQDKSYKGQVPFAKGVYNQIKTFELDLIKKALLTKTNFNYADCLDKGIEVFFGADIAVDKIQKSNMISTSPGFWFAIAKSVLKSFDQLSNAINQVSEIEGTQEEKFLILFDLIKANKLVNFANVAATVGDIALKQNNGIKNLDNNLMNNPFDVDAIPTTPGTRVAKSRENTAQNSGGRLAWRQGSVPSMYLLPRNVLRATQQMNNVVEGSNPVRGMMGSGLIGNTYFDRTHDGSNNRIPNDVVRRLEDQLEAEYVPFYIQDLRTNEIIAFHAFLTSLQDSINPTFSQTTGYGRLDPIQTYSTTTRSVSVGFTIVATSKEDYNEMWYKINKLTTLVYPQWTQGTKLSTSGVGDSFIMPFSQVLGASPVVRLRVGDVIKSNYSKFSLARMMGVGDPGINPMIEEDVFGSGINDAAGTNRKNNLKIFNMLSYIGSELYYATSGTPLQYIPQEGRHFPNNKAANVGTNLGLRIIRDLLSNQFLHNGFVNPLAFSLVNNKLSNPNHTILPTNAIQSFSVGGGLADLNLIQRGKIKANMVKGYRCEEDGEYYYLSRPADCVIEKLVQGDPIFENKKGKIVKKDTKMYKVKIIDSTAGFDLLGKSLFVYHEDIIPDISDVFINTTGALNFIASPVSFVDYLNRLLDDTLLSLGIGSDALTDVFDAFLGSESQAFMSAENNPFVRAYETTMGRGLAGVLGNLQFNWLDNDFTWETDYNARAPKGVQVSLSLSVIHDIAPGLDHSGYNRAPLYNVGDIMKESAGDVYDNDRNPEYQYRKSRIKFKTGE